MLHFFELIISIDNARWGIDNCPVYLGKSHAGIISTSSYEADRHRDVSSPVSMSSTSVERTCTEYCMHKLQIEAATNEFGEPDQSFQYYPPGETTPIPLTFSLIPEDFLADPLVFPVIQNDPRICGSITKRAPINQICIQGDSACNGGYEYVVTVKNSHSLIELVRTSNTSEEIRQFWYRVQAEHLIRYMGNLVLHSRYQALRRS